MLANRLKIVVVNQSALTLGRLIIDNILVAFELSLYEKFAECRR